MSSQAFNPLLYSSSNSPSVISYQDHRDDRTFDEIVTKGGNKNFNVDIDHFDSLCKKFRNKHHLKIKELRGEDKDDFNLVVSYVHLLRPTSYYNHFYDKVINYFGDLDRIVPGTVGGYFGGCLVKTTFDETSQGGCSAVCAGSIPRPKDDEGWSFCDKAVVFAEYGKKGYEFTMLKEAEDNEDLDPCYLFVEQTSLKEFKGFSKNEIRKLTGMGIEYIHLVGCDENGTEYVELYPDEINIHDIKSRHIKSENSSLTWLIIIILLIIFLLIVLGYYYKFYNH